MTIAMLATTSDNTKSHIVIASTAILQAVDTVKTTVLDASHLSAHAVQRCKREVEAS